MKAWLAAVGLTLTEAARALEVRGFALSGQPGYRAKVVGWRLGALTAALALLTSCDALRFERSNKEVNALLYQSNGTLDNVAATAAMNRRFPAGSKVTDLESLVRSVGGRCGRWRGQTYCEIPTRGTVCVENAIILTVLTAPAGDTIEHIDVRGAMTGC